MPCHAVRRHLHLFCALLTLRSLETCPRTASLRVRLGCGSMDGAHVHVILTSPRHCAVDVYLWCDRMTSKPRRDQRIGEDDGLHSTGIYHKTYIQGEGSRVVVHVVCSLIDGLYHTGDDIDGRSSPSVMSVRLERRSWTCLLDSAGSPRGLVPGYLYRTVCSNCDPPNPLPASPCICDESPISLFAGGFILEWCRCTGRQKKQSRD